MARRHTEVISCTRKMENNDYWTELGVAGVAEDVDTELGRRHRDVSEDRI